MYQNPATGLLLFISQNNLKCKIFASCPKSPTQKRRNVKGKRYFSSLLVSSRFDFPPNQKSKVYLVATTGRGSVPSNRPAMKFRWNCKTPIRLQIRVSPDNRPVLPRNCGFLTSVNQFSHLNIWIWEIEWGWSFFGTSSPENWKLKIQRRTFIHNFLSLKKVKHTHLECKAQDHFALESHHPNEIVKWSDPELFWILIWYEINSNSQTFGQIFENSQFLLVILSPVQGANKQLLQ